MSQSLRIENIICAHPHLFEKHAVPGTTNSKYSIELLFDPTMHAAQIQQVQDAFYTELRENNKAELAKTIKSPLQDGNQINQARQMKGKSPLSHYANRFVLRASDGTTAPGVVDRNMQPISESNSAAIFSGCIVNVFVDLYWYALQTNPGVYCGLRGVQLVDNVNTVPIEGGHDRAPETMFEKVTGPEPMQAPAENTGPAPAPQGPSWL